MVFVLFFPTQSFYQLPAYSQTIVLPWQDNMRLIHQESRGQAVKAVLRPYLIVHERKSPCPFIGKM
jgi:hypothetical protein